MCGTVREQSAGRDLSAVARLPVELAMTIPTVLPVPRSRPAVVAEQRHPGCWWSWERAAWVRWAPVPPPRRPSD